MSRGYGFEKGGANRSVGLHHLAGNVRFDGSSVLALANEYPMIYWEGAGRLETLSPAVIEVGPEVRCLVGDPDLFVKDNWAEAVGGELDKAHPLVMAALGVAATQKTLFVEREGLTEHFEGNLTVLAERLVVATTKPEITLGGFEAHDRHFTAIELIQDVVYLLTTGSRNGQSYARVKRALGEHLGRLRSGER